MIKFHPSGTTSLTILRLNSRGAAVKSLQEKLKKLGFSVGAADGIFGRKTEEAIQAFCTVHGKRGRGSAVGFCNGKATLGKETLETTIIIGEAGYAQSREIAEVLGYNLEWKQATREVIFTKGER
ncbi:peptidoglycan-binding protein [Aneurinibacillus migulanus]|uniref:Putative peptidoglycan binding domain-containing protein n=1 Tax=Aneurinibacillus migulanus TaxID=47500 RepID=A0A1G9CD26_ANEMI|nr:peptidoglycan-binding protein [Aneurinibacillus migulanus]MED0895696.1 peptidoglycan-binding protein [Aneurinibacillus migulanus]MED1619717.1 peptidoglycan-binding protein [Aneurinibacillus migulanus]SDK49547.1 Putative peptidoglycan binding domain-containing protein [Aneurinibacillus migulanus]